MTIHSKFKIQHCLLHCFYWVSFAMLLSYGSAFLLAKGFSNTSIGIIFSISFILSVILQPVIANIIDNNKSITEVKTLIIIAIYTII